MEDIRIGPQLSESELKRAEAPLLCVGEHVSVSTKPRNVLERAHAEGFCCLQIFASSPSSWHVPSKDSDAFAAFHTLWKEIGIEQLYLHAIYLINLAAVEERIYEASIRSLIWTLNTGAAMGATGVVVHIGSHRGRGFAEVRTQVIRGLTCVLEGAPPTIALLLENNAGTGGCIGADFDELGAIIADLGHPSNVGVCLDTAHIFAMGYDIRTQDGLERVLAALEESVGLERLALIHANDSKTPLGARRDRHANIGEGEIGLVGFETLFSRPELRGLPFVLETPQLDRRVHDLAALRAAYERAVARNS